VRKISATYIFPCNRPPLKNGILISDDSGVILELIDTGGNLQEQAGLEHYSGILLPGFVNAHNHPELSNLNALTTHISIFKKHRAGANTFFVLRPNSNLYIENKLPDVAFFDNEDLNICPETDGLTSYQNLSVLRELITLQQHFPELTIGKLAEWACLNGARALGIDNRYGSFEPGKKPGINLITGLDLQQLKLTQNSKIKVLQSA
jgi:cytosine/adenosine deaminase-related metal-dependent hydrolase